MPWSGDGVFTRTDGTREGSEVWDEARQALVKINAPDMDRHDQDQAEGIQACLAKNGENEATADLPMDGHKHTGVENAAASDQYAAFGQVLALTTPFIGAAAIGGTGSAVELTPDPAVTEYQVGRGYRYFSENENGGEATVSISGLAPVAMRRTNGNALEDGDILVGTYVVLIYNGSHFRTNIAPPPAEQNDAGLSEGEVELIVAQLVFDFAETGDVSTVPLNKVPNLPAGRITSGTFNQNRIPDLNASKVTAGTLDAPRVGSEVGAVPGKKILYDDGVFRFPFEFPSVRLLEDKMAAEGLTETSGRAIMGATISYEAGAFSSISGHLSGTYSGSGSVHIRVTRHQGQLRNLLNEVLAMGSSAELDSTANDDLLSNNTFSVMTVFAFGTSLIFHAGTTLTITVA